MDSVLNHSHVAFHFGLFFSYAQIIVNLLELKLFSYCFAPLGNNLLNILRKLPLTAGSIILRSQQLLPLRFCMICISL